MKLSSRLRLTSDGWRALRPQSRGKMHRRTFISGSAGLVSLGAPTLLRAREKPLKVGVVGGGIIGASIAMHLAQAGADVTLFERVAPASGASGKSMAWINPIVLDAHYRDLRLLSMERWKELNDPLDLKVTWGGSITWAADDARAASVRARAELLRGTLDEPRMLADDKALTALSPAVQPGPIKGAFFAPIDGHVDAPFATGQFLKEAARHGAKVLYPCPVTGVHLEGGKIAGVSTSQGKFALDCLVSASGVDTPKVMALAGYSIRLLHAPGITIHTAPLPSLTKMVYDANGILELKQMLDGRIAVDYAAGPPDLPQHAGIRDHAMDYPSEALKTAHGQSVLRKAAAWMPGVADAKLEKVMLCFRPMPTDRLPVVGAVPGVSGLYAVVTHSGVTLAPIIGQYVSQEIMIGEKASMLAPYRPERFA